MRFFWSMLVYILFAVLIGWGILSLVHGNPWVLVASAGIYLLLMIKIGCLPSKSH